MKYVIEEKPTETKIEALLKAITSFVEQNSKKGANLIVYSDGHRFLSDFPELAQPFT
jgi:intracellular sulfur oxidation DsrE/DsrF family protein